MYARVERRMFRVLSGRLFAHILRLPLRFHLDRKTGAVSQTLENGLTGYQMILHHLVFTLLPVTAELGTIIIVLVRLGHPVFLLLFCGALVCYAVVFTYAATTIARAGPGCPQVPGPRGSAGWPRDVSPRNWHAAKSNPHWPPAPYF